MSSSGKRERSLPLVGPVSVYDSGKLYSTIKSIDGILRTGKQITVSESHPINRKTGKYDAGGPFFTSRVTPFLKPGGVDSAFSPSLDRFYSGPVYGNFPTSGEMTSLGFGNPSLQYGSKNESSMKILGTNAISYISPTNPAANLGTTLAELHREGLPSLPGVQTWKDRTKILKGLGSEYLNYQFGWAPLHSEVKEVSSAIKHRSTIMKNYENGEGKNTHRLFEYPLIRSEKSKSFGTEYFTYPYTSFLDFSSTPQREVSWVSETKRWFEGCFTYALPSSTDSWRRSLSISKDAEQLLGLSLTPNLLWELTPWSWAVDWFSNAGEVVNNVTNFGLAGLVMRYGYMMEESIDIITANVQGGKCITTPKKAPRTSYSKVDYGSWSCGYEIVTKRRIPASPFGFSIGWEGLSPTQLAITAALGITKFL
jgi:hypothetical protein